MPQEASPNNPLSGEALNTQIVLNTESIKTMKKDLAGKMVLPYNSQISNFSAQFAEKIPENLSAPKAPVSYAPPKPAPPPPPASIKTSDNQPLRAGESTVILSTWQFNESQKTAVTQAPPAPGATKSNVILPQTPPKPPAMPSAAKPIISAADKAQSLDKENAPKAQSNAAFTIKEETADIEQKEKAAAFAKQETSISGEKQKAKPLAQAVKEEIAKEPPLKKIESPAKPLSLEETIAAISKKRQIFEIKYAEFSKNFTDKIVVLRQTRDALKKEKENILEQKQAMERKDLYPLEQEEKRIEEESRAIAQKIKPEETNDELEQKRSRTEQARKEIERKRWAVEEQTLQLEKKIRELDKKYEILSQDEERAYKEKENLMREQDAFAWEEEKVRLEFELEKLKNEKEKISSAYAQMLPKKNIVNKTLQELITEKNKNENEIAQTEEKERLAQGADRRHFEEQRQTMEEKREQLYKKTAQIRQEQRTIEEQAKESASKMQTLNRREEELLKKIETFKNQISAINKT